jgi:protein-S-isoprenylcysteine O-methyltransferase Ste14
MCMRLVLWLWWGWGLYWLLSALRNKATARRESLASRLTHLLPLALGAALLAWPHPRWSALAWRMWPPSPAACWIGVAMVTAGLAFAIWARVHLGGNWSGTVTVKEGHELIRSGPYAPCAPSDLHGADHGTARHHGRLRHRACRDRARHHRRVVRAQVALRGGFHARNLPRRVPALQRRGTRSHTPRAVSALDTALSAPHTAPPRPVTA